MEGNLNPCVTCMEESSMPDPKRPFNGSLKLNLYRKSNDSKFKL